MLQIRGQEALLCNQINTVQPSNLSADRTKGTLKRLYKQIPKMIQDASLYPNQVFRGEHVMEDLVVAFNP